MLGNESKNERTKVTKANQTNKFEAESDSKHAMIFCKPMRSSRLLSPLFLHNVKFAHKAKVFYSTGCGCDALVFQTCFTPKNV
jgi:hypothetical protein